MTGYISFMKINNVLNQPTPRLRISWLTPPPGFENFGNCNRYVTFEILFYHTTKCSRFHFSTYNMWIFINF